MLKNTKSAYFKCRCCHDPNIAMYMLHNYLWKSIWDNSGYNVDPDDAFNELLCWTCAEKVLGRRIEAKDLNPLSNCNQVYYILFKRMQEERDFVQGCLC